MSTRWLLTTSGLVGLVLGALSARGQGQLPHQLAGLVNSNGSWVLIAFLLALPARRALVAALSSTLALGALLAGFYGDDLHRHYAISHRGVAFWVLAAVLVGPLVGLSAAWIRAGQPARAAAGTGLIAGVLIGEGWYGLTRIDDSTYAPYWWAQTGVGVVFLLTLAIRQLRTREAIGYALMSTAMIAIGFVCAFHVDWIAVLSTA
jgi:hypothetical protein